MYEGLRIDFTMWHIVGGIYGYKKLIRLPRKQKKALKKSTLRDVIAKDRNYGSSSNLVVISFLFQLSSSFLILLKVVDMFAF